jgi:hypothetical protein
VEEGRTFITGHAEEKLSELGVDRDTLLETVATGFVLPRRERGETGAATDGYKHFLEGMTPSGAIIEVVFKFVKARTWPVEELMILITAYRGSV